MDGGMPRKVLQSEQRSKDVGLHLEANDSRFCQNNAKTRARKGRQATLAHV
jgi:hypothetical protein